MTALTLALAGGGLLVGLVSMGRVRVLPAAHDVCARVPLSVVVPARNEAERLPRLLASLAAQTRPAGRIVVVDDASDDETAEVARRYGVEVVTIDGPGAGWAGKTWACQVGLRTIDPGAEALIAFVDADVWLAPDGLHRLAGAHAAEVPDGLLSVQPFHVTERAYEQLSAVANVVAVMASGLAAARAPRSCAVAFGPCLVTTAGALAAAGGFESVRSETIEDIALAGRYRRAGRPVRCLAGGVTVRFRMYGDGLSALLAGWTKNLAGGARRAAPLPTAGAIVWVAGALAVPVAAIADPSPGTVALYAAYAAQLWWMLRRLGRFRWWTAMAFPVPTIMFVGLFGASVVRRGIGRSVVWRGRRLAVGR